MQTTIESGIVTKMNMPARLLRLEGLALLAAAVALYAWQGYSWLWFVLFFFLPDIALFVYLVNRETGRTVYNLLHTTTFPLALAIVGAITGSAVLLPAGLIWLAHIGLDRAIGYGLKYSAENKDTHLQRV